MWCHRPVIPAEIGGSEVQGCPQLHSEVKVCLGALKSCLKKQTFKACAQQFPSFSKSPPPKSSTTIPGNATNCGPRACGESFTFTPHQKIERQILFYFFLFMTIVTTSHSHLRCYLLPVIALCPFGHRYLFIDGINKVL